MATDGSNVVVALYSQAQDTIGVASFRTDAESVSGSADIPGVGIPYVARGGTNFLLVWLAGTNSLDLHGQFLGREEFIILSGLSSVKLSGLSWDGQSFLVLWTLISNGASAVQGQLLDSGAFPIGDPITLSGSAANAPESAVTAGTNHLVVWMESTGATNEWHTRARVVDSFGSLSETVTLISTPAMSADPVTIAWGKDRALAVWSRESGPFPAQNCCGGGFCFLETNYFLLLYGRMLDADGSIHGAEFQIGYAGGNQRKPAAAFDEREFLVIWSDTRFGDCATSFASALLVGLKIDANGNQLGLEVRITSSWRENSPEALVFVGGQFLSIMNRSLGSLSDGDFARVLRPFVNVAGLGNLTFLSNGCPQVEFTGIVSHGSSLLQVSTNLVDWSFARNKSDPIYLVGLQTNKTVQWMDPFPNVPGPRFYRSVNATELCVSNLLLIDHIKSIWAFDHAKRIWDEPTDADLFGPGRYLPQKPSCPLAPVLGSTYFLRDVVTRPYCTLEAAGHIIY